MSQTSSVTVGLGVQLSKMDRNFWVANTMEAFERLAFFGVRAVLPLYMVATEGQGLGLCYKERGGQFIFQPGHLFRPQEA